MTTFNDIENHWAKTCIEQLTLKNVISGYKDGSFKPDATVTRAEFAAMLNQAFPNQSPIRPSQEFTDVKKDYWAYSVIDKTYRVGFLSGYPDNTFKPQQAITRVQVLVALTTGLNLKTNQLSDDILNSTLNDTQGIPSYARQAVTTAIANGFVINYPQVRQLNPNQSATRAEVAAFLGQALLKPGEASSIPEQYQVKIKAETTQKGELRGVWLTNIDSEVLFSKTALTDALKFLAEYKFNTVYPTIWNGGYTLYPSAVMERVTGVKVDPTPGLRERNLLTEIVAESQAQRFSVIPWFEFGFMANPDTPIVRSRPHWLTCRQDGTQIVKEGTENRVWLNPFHPQVQQFILDLIVEVIQYPGLQGIQFDDHFGLPVELGYDAFTTKLYRQEHNGKAPPSNPKDSAWMKWRADKITEFVMRIFWVIKDYNPNFILALSPNSQAYAYNNHLQDWQTWEQLGFIEELVVQVYREDLNAFTVELERPEVLAAKRHIPVGVGILTGLKSKPMTLSVVKSQIEKVRDRNFSGVSFFFYESLKSILQVESNQTEFKALFPESIERPQLIAASMKI